MIPIPISTAPTFFINVCMSVCICLHVSNMHSCSDPGLIWPDHVSTGGLQLVDTKDAREAAVGSHTCWLQQLQALAGFHI